MRNEYRELRKKLYRDEKKHWVSMTEEERNMLKEAFERTYGLEFRRPRSIIERWASELEPITDEELREELIKENERWRIIRETDERIKASQEQNDEQDSKD